VKCGEVLGTAVPKAARPAISAIVVDAGCGFAHAGIDAEFEHLLSLASEVSIAGDGGAEFL